MSWTNRENHISFLQYSCILCIFPVSLDGLVWFPLGLTSLISLQSRHSQESSPTLQLKSINSSALRLLYGPTLTCTCDYWKAIALTRQSGLLFPSPGDPPEPEIQPRSPTLQEDSWPAKLQGGHTSYQYPVFQSANRVFLFTYLDLIFCCLCL